MEDNMPTRDIIAENQTAAAISKLRRGEADDALRDEVQAATLSTMQKMLEELAGLKSSMWSKNDLKTLIDEEQSRHCDHCPTREWVDSEISRRKLAQPEPEKPHWFTEIIKSESLRYFILIALLVYALIYVKSGIEGVEAVKEGVTHTVTGGVR